MDKMNKPWTDYSKFRLKYVLISPVIVGLIALGLWYYHVHRPVTNPDIGAAQATHALLANVQQLKVSLNQPVTSTKDVGIYIQYMSNLVQTCQTIQHFNQLAISQNIPSTVARLATSSQTCNDLSKLATNSAVIYVYIKPLLSIDPHLKRYQTIYPIVNITRQRQLNEVSKASNQLNGLVSHIDFPTTVVEALKQLEVTIKQSQGLTYYPQLLTFQQKLLAERQQYWLDYGDIGGLERSLQMQLSDYCQSLKVTKDNPSYCASGA